MTFLCARIIEYILCWTVRLMAVPLASENNAWKPCKLGILNDLANGIMNKKKKIFRIREWDSRPMSKLNSTSCVEIKPEK